MNSWSPSDTPVISLEPCDISCCDVTPLRGLKPAVLLDLIYLMGLLEEQGWLDSHVTSKRKPQEGTMKESEPQHMQDEDVSADIQWQMEDEMNNCKEPKTDADFQSQSQDTKIGEQQETSHLQAFQASQTSKLDAFAVELRAVRVSYLLIGALKSLTVIFSCEKLSDLLQVPKHDPSVSLSSPPTSPNPEQARARGKQWDESAELRSVLQYVVQSMVKWAVRPCPIKQSVSLADLERAQIMIYKGGASRLQEKEQKGLSPLTDSCSKLDHTEGLATRTAVSKLFCAVLTSYMVLLNYYYIKASFCLLTNNISTWCVFVCCVAHVKYNPYCCCPRYYILRIFTLAVCRFWPPLVSAHVQVLQLSFPVQCRFRGYGHFRPIQPSLCFVLQHGPGVLAASEPADRRL